LLPATGSKNMMVTQWFNVIKLLALVASERIRNAWLNIHAGSLNHCWRIHTTEFQTICIG
jgi:hypothetical protein